MARGNQREQARAKNQAKVINFVYFEIRALEFGDCLPTVVGFRFSTALRLALFFSPLSDESSSKCRLLSLSLLAS